MDDYSKQLFFICNNIAFILIFVLIWSVQSKDILQERIDSLQSERTNLKIENEKLMVDLEKTKNEITEMTEVSFVCFQISLTYW